MSVATGALRRPPIEASATPAADQRILIDWAMALQDAGNLAQVLSQIIAAYPIEVAALARWDTGAGTHRILALADRQHAKPMAPQFRRSCADCVLDESPGTALDGSIWIAEQLDRRDGRDRWIADWCRERHIHQVVVVVLRRGRRFCDVLELHLTEQMPGGPHGRFRALAQALAYAWAGRRAGCILERYWAASHTRRIEPATEPGNGILDSTNPSGLSRAEFRVCVLAGRGMSAHGIAQELGLTDSTVRSHLRSIYAKTGVVGQAQLMYRLHGPPAPKLRKLAV
jgi:DNA-binding CsgD family transcriptional regulator